MQNDFEISEDEGTCEDTIDDKIESEEKDYLEHGRELMVTKNFLMENDSDVSEDDETVDINIIILLNNVIENQNKKTRYLCPVSCCTYQLSVDDPNLQSAHLNLKHSSLKPTRFLAI